MFPLRDVIPSRTTPWVTYSLIGLGVCLFAAERASLIAGLTGWPALPVSAVFHHGWLALVPNIVCLWIFGDNVEDRFGHGRFLIFYLLAAAAAGVTQLSLSDATVPTVASSGAVAAIMGAYFVLFPSSRVLVGVFLIVLVDAIELPAIFLLLVWSLFVVVPHIDNLSGGAGAGGFWALVVGFAIGVGGVWVFKRPERQRVDWWGR